MINSFEIVNSVMDIRAQLCFAVVNTCVYVFGNVQVTILVSKKQSVVTRIIKEKEKCLKRYLLVHKLAITLNSHIKTNRIFLHCHKIFFYRYTNAVEGSCSVTTALLLMTEPYIYVTTSIYSEHFSLSVLHFLDRVSLKSSSDYQLPLVFSVRPDTSLLEMLLFFLLITLVAALVNGRHIPILCKLLRRSCCILDNLSKRILCN